MPSMKRSLLRTLLRNLSLLKTPTGAFQEHPHPLHPLHFTFLWGTSRWPQPPRFSQKHCNTNRRRTAIQTGGVLRHKHRKDCNTNWRRTAIQMGGALRYFFCWEVVVVGVSGVFLTFPYFPQENPPDTTHLNLTPSPSPKDTSRNSHPFAKTTPGKKTTALVSARNEQETHKQIFHRIVPGPSQDKFTQQNWRVPNPWC